MNNSLLNMDLLKKIKSCIKKSECINDETKRRSLIKFLVIFSIAVVYFAFITFEYGVGNGIAITVLTWTFFVFCTPIADAGFLFDFPVRVLAKIRMIYSEIGVWCIAFLINIYFIIFNQQIYESTSLLKLFRHILFHPFPFWTIILISAIGTFVSAHFGDELIDVVKHKHRKTYIKHRNKYIFILILFAVIIISFILYYYLLAAMGIKI